MPKQPATLNPSLFVPLVLDGHFNLDATAGAAAPWDGSIDGLFALAAEELPPPGRVSLLGVDFLFPDTSRGRADCLVPAGQKIAVPRGEYAVLFALGTSVFGSSGMDLVLEFSASGGTERVVEALRFSDWCHEARFGDLDARECRYRYAPSGPVEESCRIRLQYLFLPPGRRLEAVLLGPGSNVRLFALTLGRRPYVPPPESHLRRLLEGLSRISPEAGRVLSLYGSAGDARGLLEGDDGGLGERLDAVRGGILGEFSTADLFSGDAERVAASFRKWIPELETMTRGARRRLAAAVKPGPLRVTLLGHSHLDAVWLWPWNETVGKAKRTFEANVERLVRHPGAVFAQSSPLFFAWMERFFPGLFEKIRALVAAGRIEPVGGMWVEADGNMPCGEALFRQRLLGQRFYLDRFGKTSEVAWFPDTFGMHANIPQIVARTGGKYFFTTKLSWNDTNDFPYHHFLWESPDGSRVLALQSPIGCGAEPGPHEGLEESVRRRNVLLEPGREAVVSAADPFVPENALSGEFVPDVLVIYGEGDGGEGPTETLYRRAGTLASLPGYAHGTARGHFRRVDGKYRDRLPVWRDELYLETHRGAVSSQGRIKELNREGEALLLAAEKWSVLEGFLPAGGREGDGSSSRRAALREAWERLLFNQFHDILPGTSLPQAYVDAEFDFDRVLRSGGEVLRKAVAAIASRIDTTAPDGREGEGAPFATGRALLVFNPLSWGRDETIEIPWGYPGVNVVALDGKLLPSSVVFRDGRRSLVFRAPVPAMGYSQVRLLAGKRPPLPEHPVSASGRMLENRFLRVTLDGRGNLSGIRDKERGIDLLAGPGNELLFFRNRPKDWSNWNLDPDYDAHRVEAGGGEALIEVVDEGPVTAALRAVSAAPGGGRVVREIRLFSDERRIEFTTDVDVRYRESLVKVSFPFEIGADHVTTEIGYGRWKRPVRPGTSFERAKWEVWTQKWLDLSGPGGGVTLASLSRYGFDVEGDRIRLTMVKGGIMPDPDTDLCSHRVRYALYPHEGSFEAAHAWRRGYEFNFPLFSRLEEEHPGTLPREASLASVAPGNVCWEVVKEAEDAGGGIVARIFETEGVDVPSATLSFPFAVARAEEVDGLELNAVGEVEWKGNRVTFPIGHDEIKTIRVVPEGKRR